MTSTRATNSTSATPGDLPTAATNHTGAAARRPWEPRLDLDTEAPAFSQAMSALEHAARQEAERAGLSDQLLHLVRLRASQLNGCAYCIDMHAKDARTAGASDEQLFALTAWPEAPCYDELTRAALELAEAMTLCADEHVADASFDAVAARYTSSQMAALVAVIVTINAWNRIGAATRAWLPGSYQP